MNSVYIEKLNKYDHKFKKLLVGGVLRKTTISCISKYNIQIDKNELVFEVLLNENFEFCKFILTQFDNNYVDRFLKKVLIFGETISDSTQTILKKPYPIYYLSDFYTTLMTKFPDMSTEITPENKTEYENTKILENDVVLYETKGVATIALKYAINKLIEKHKSPIIVCCEPILGQRENALNYKNIHMSNEERYDNLLSYYSSLGLNNKTKVFMILHLFNEKERSYETPAEFEENLSLRKRQNKSMPTKKYFETRDFIIDIIENPYEISNEITTKKITYIEEY